MSKVTLGVFQVDWAWKLYADDRARAPYPSRNEAVRAGESAARAALHRGWSVELFLQDETGELRRAPLARLAH